MCDGFLQNDADSESSLRRFLRRCVNDAKTQAFPDHCIQDLRRNFLKFQTLRDDAKFLRAHNKQEEGHLLARLESGGRDTCDNCDCEIFNAHWVCRSCGRSHCRECPFDALQICPQRNAVHAVEVAVIHSGISRKSRRFFWRPRIFVLSRGLISDRKKQKLFCVNDAELKMLLRHRRKYCVKHSNSFKYLI